MQNTRKYKEQNNSLSPQNFKIPFDGIEWILTLTQEINSIKFTFFNKTDLPKSVFESNIIIINLLFYLLW